MTRAAIPVAAALFAFGAPAYALECQDAPAQFPPRTGSVGLIVENDAFGDGSDDNYSNGVQANVRADFADSPAPVRWLGRRIADLNGLEPQSYGLAIGHLLFTPSDIDSPIPPKDQRPYAGFLYLQSSFVAARGDEIRSIEITLGLVGPSAGGEWVQREFHSLINAVDPQGWDAQLEDEVAFVIDADRRWRSIAATDVGRLSFDLSPNIGLGLGTLRTEARVGVTARLGEGLENDFGPPRIRPALAGAGLVNAEPGLRGYGFIGVYGRAVARDLFLDGNTFQDSARVNKETFVGDLQAGFVFQAGSTSLAYTYVLRSPEYETQRNAQSFGAFTITRRW